MSDATVTENDSLEMDEVLEKITFYCFDEAKEKLNADGECTPFTVVVDGEQMFVESHPGEDVERCQKSAVHTVKSASEFASHYAFCYDGFLMTDDGQVDALIVECASNDMDHSFVIALLYKEQGEDVVYEPQPVYVDDGETYFDLDAVKAAQEKTRQQQLSDAELAKHLGAEER